MQYIRKSNTQTVQYARKMLMGTLAVAIHPADASLTGDEVTRLMDEFELSILDLVHCGTPKRTVNSWRLFGRSGEEAMEIIETLVYAISQVTVSLAV